MSFELNRLSYAVVTRLVQEARDTLVGNEYRLNLQLAIKDSKIKKIIVDRFIKEGELINNLLDQMREKAEAGEKEAREKFDERMFILVEIDTLFDLFKGIYKDFTNNELDKLVKQPIPKGKPSPLHAKLGALEDARVYVLARRL